MYSSLGVPNSSNISLIWCFVESPLRNGFLNIISARIQPTDHISTRFNFKDKNLQQYSVKSQPIIQGLYTNESQRNMSFTHLKQFCQLVHGLVRNHIFWHHNCCLVKDYEVSKKFIIKFTKSLCNIPAECIYFKPLKI